MRKQSLIAALTLGVGMAHAASPFAVTAALERVGGEAAVAVSATVPAGHQLYADMFAVHASTGTLSLLQPLPTQRKYDPISDGEREVLAHDFTARYRLAGWDGRAPLRATVAFQGCSETICFLPDERGFALADGDAVDGAAAAATTAPVAWTNGLRVIGRASGFMDARTFLAALDLVEGRAPTAGRGRAGTSGDFVPPRSSP